MVNFADLKIPQLKKELEARGLSVTGQKADLQARLREVMEAEGIEVEEHEFHQGAPETVSKIGGNLEEPRSTSAVDMNSLLVALTGMADRMQANMHESLAEHSLRLEERLQASLTENSSQVREQLSRIEESSAKLQARQDKVEEEVNTLHHKVEGELQALNHKLQNEILCLDKRVRELQLNGSVTSTKFKAPTFDGTVPFKIFKLQFETTASTNHWRDEDKVAALVVSLKGSAAEVLQTVPEIERNDYDALMAAIERRYGSEHRKQIFQMELLNRYQKANETLQEYATEIERLAHLANADAPAEFVERVKIQSFINGIRDVDTKRATYSMPKITFAETVSHALTQETATLLSRPAHKIHRVEVDQPASLENTMKELIQSLSQVTRGLRNSSEVKCFNCGKPGHIARNCTASRNQQNSNPSGRKRSAENENGASGVQQSLN